MGEIKSTLDLVMEKTRHLTASDEEKKAQKKAEIEKQSKIFQALSEPLRLKIVLAIAEQPMCVCMLKDLIDPKLADSRLSYHINILKDTGLIKGTRNQSWIIYEATKSGKEAARAARKL